MGIRRVGKVTAVLGVSAMLLAGCGLFGPSEEASIDPPKSDVSVEGGSIGVDKAAPGTDENGAAATAQAKTERTVYLLDANGFVVPVMLSLPKVEGSAKQVLTYMVKGGPVQNLLPQGFAAILPEGTKVLGMTIKNGLATVDFSPEFKKYAKEDEEKIVDAVTLSLTEFESIKNVSIWVNGTPLTEMPVDNTPVSHLDRKQAINLELADGATPGRTTPITIYFQGQLDDQRSYFVPVTRLVPETGDVAKAVVEELIKGPKEGAPLYSSLLKTTKVNHIEEKDGLVKVDLSDDVLKYDSGKEANPDAMEALVLSLTETTGAKKVQITVDGKPLASSGGLDFSKPVVRPTQINSMQF